MNKSELIQYPIERMWDMTQQELDAYVLIADRKDPFPFDLLKKYRLSQARIYGQFEHAVCPPHYLVCRWLESHPADRERWRLPGFMYYDILRKAEQEYLGLPSWEERPRD